MNDEPERWLPPGDFSLVPLRIPAELFEALQATARAASTSVPTYVRRLIEQAVKPDC